MKRRAAKTAKGEGGNFLATWWNKKYKLPLNHKLYQTRTPASLMQEFLEDLHERKTEMQQLLETAEISARPRIYERIAAIDKVLHDEELAGPMVTGDRLVDDWEEMLDRGDDPNLEADLGPEVMKRFKSGDSRD